MSAFRLERRALATGAPDAGLCALRHRGVRDGLWLAPVGGCVALLEKLLERQRVATAFSCSMATQASVGVVTRMRTDSVRSSIPVVSRSSNPLDDDDDDDEY